MIDLHALRRDNPLTEVAACVVALRPAGKEWVACCPFHADRSPSFTIFDGGQRFHCFGCGASGDVLDFVQRAYAVSLPEAARLLGAGDVPTVALPAAREFPRAVKPDTQAGALRSGTGPNRRQGRWQRLICRSGASIPPIRPICGSWACPATIWGHCPAWSLRCATWRAI